MFSDSALSATSKAKLSYRLIADHGTAFAQLARRKFLVLLGFQAVAIHIADELLEHIDTMARLGPRRAHVGLGPSARFGTMRTLISSSLTL
jgi:hypothetical protein